MKEILRETDESFYTLEEFEEFIKEEYDLTLYGDNSKSDYILGFDSGGWVVYKP